MRKRAFHIVLSALVACTVFVCALACVPMTALAVEGDPALASAAAERVAWAKTQSVSAVSKLATEQGSATDASVRVYQKFDSSYTGVARTFEYRLVPITQGAPMPEGTENGIYVWTFTDDDAGWIRIPCADAPATEGDTVYYYAAYQHVTDPQSDYTYDNTVFVVEAHVLANTHEAVAIIRNSDANEDKITDPGWTVRYEKSKPTAGDNGTSGGSGNENTKGSNDAANKGTKSGTYQSSYVAKGGSDALAKTGDVSDVAVICLCLLSGMAVLAGGMALHIAKGGVYRG